MYHDSRSWTADIHVDRALIVAHIELDWGACVVSDPASDWSCAPIKCTVCCVHFSSGWSVFTGAESEICLISDRSIFNWQLSGAVCAFFNSFWCVTGWWSVNTLTTFWGEGEDEWSRWWTESLRWVARISPQGSNRFPRRCSVLLLHSHYFLIHPEDSSSWPFLVQKQTLGHFVLQSDA